METKEAVEVVNNFLNSVYPSYMKRFVFRNTLNHLQGITKIKTEPVDTYSYGENYSKDVTHFVHKVYPLYMRTHMLFKLL